MREVLRQENTMRTHKTRDEKTCPQNYGSRRITEVMR